MSTKALGQMVLTASRRVMSEVRIVNRIKGRTLRDKIEARFGSLPPSFRKRFPKMWSVIDHCVRVRNYFVHSSKSKLSDAVIERHHVVLTETLESIFVLSELHACGWRPNKWLKMANMGQIRHYVRVGDLERFEPSNMGRPSRLAQARPAF